MVGRADCVVTAVGGSGKWFDASRVLFLLALEGRRGRALHLRREEMLPTAVLWSRTSLRSWVMFGGMLMLFDPVPESRGMV